MTSKSCILPRRTAFEAGFCVWTTELRFSVVCFLVCPLQGAGDGGGTFRPTFYWLDGGLLQPRRSPMYRSDITRTIPQSPSDRTSKLIFCRQTAKMQRPRERMSDASMENILCLDLSKAIVLVFVPPPLKHALKSIGSKTKSSGWGVLSRVSDGGTTVSCNPVRICCLFFL